MAVEAAFESIGPVFGGGRWRPASPDVGGERTMALPAANVLVRFAEERPDGRH